MIQLKNVPEDVHRELKRRADQSRTSIRDYVLRLIETDQQVQPLQDWLARLDAREPLAAHVDVSELIRRDREERTQQILGAVHGDPGR